MNPELTQSQLDTLKNSLQEYLGKYYDNSSCDKFATFFSLLFEYNQKFNLVADCSWDQFLYRHILDSLVLIKHDLIAYNAVMTDIGSGAGFPGLPLKIALPKSTLYSIESTNKKANFQKHVSDILELRNSNIMCNRVEDFAHTPPRTRSIITTARAVAKLHVLAEYSLPLLKLGGKAIFMKQIDYKEELHFAQKAIRLCGGELKDIITYQISPDQPKRAIIIIKKTRPTPLQYPRNSSMISKHPLT